MPPHDRSLGLHSLLSRALIAFTTDVDQRMDAARRAKRLREPAPSLAMWANFLRFIGEGGVEVRRLPELSGLSRPAIRTGLATLQRHGWVTIAARASASHGARAHLTAAGRKLGAVWRSAVEEVEHSWALRFGTGLVKELRSALQRVSDDCDADLPHYPMALPHRGGTPTGR